MTFNEFFRRFLAILFVLLICAGIWAARSTLLLGFAAAMIAVGISIPSSWLQRYGMRRGWSIAVSIVTVFAGLLLLLLFIVPQLITGLADLLSNVTTAIRAIFDAYEDIRANNEFLQDVLPALPTFDTTTDVSPERVRTILNQFVDASLAIAPRLLGGVGTLFAIVINLVLVLFIAVFFLIDPTTYIKASLFLLPKQFHQQAIHIWNELYQTIRTWISALSLSIIITVILVWLILGLLLGMPNAVVVAVFAGLATFVPNVGLFLPLIPIVIFSLASDTPAQVLYTVPVYLLIQLVESNIISPSIVKAELEIPPGGLMIFQLLMTLVFGALGLLLAVPFLAVLMVLIRENYSYNLLGLRDTKVQLSTNQMGNLVLLEESEIVTKDEISSTVK
ncbi:MAG: AI-2E family transporter [Chloroflexota bacterium]